jgi:CheY-like chemotaxis protein
MVCDQLPLVIGVTGHRDLRDKDVPQLEEEVGAIIRRLRRDYLDDDPQIPIIVLSSLAEGADRLVARVALAHGAQLIAPLPLPLEEYRHDFDPGLKPGNIAEFDELFAKAIAAPLMPLHGGSLELIRSDAKKRAEQYRSVGVFIVQHCHVLLALWDGDEEDMAAGGTAEVVSFKRSGIPLTVSGSARACLDGTEIGPVIEVQTPRLKEKSTSDRIVVRPWGRAVIRRYRGGTLRWFRRAFAVFVGNVLRRPVEDECAKLAATDRHELETWENFEALIDLTRKFNREAASLAKSRDGPARLALSLDELFTDSGRTEPDADAKARALDLAPLWCRLYAIADTLALERQTQFQRDWKLLFCFGIIALICLAMFTHAGLVQAVFMIGYVLTFAVGLFFFVRAVRRQDQARYLDYRALAEALRVAIFWKLLGIGSGFVDAKAKIAGYPLSEPNPIGMIANVYPIKQPSELAWVKVCLRTLERLDKPDDRPIRRIDPVGHVIARRFWVHGQFKYFGRQGSHHNLLAESIQAYSDILVLLPPILIGFLLFRRAWDFVIFVVGLLPIGAAALSGYSERLAFKAQARQYDRMRTLFERAYHLLPRAIDDANASLAHALYHELGTEAMRESAEWVAIYRERPLQPLR